MLNAPAMRVISLYSAYNEILIEMNSADILIAKTNAETSSLYIEQLPSIGTHMRPNLELIVGMQPDLVLQMGGRDAAVQSVYDLERLGITVAYFSVTTFDDLFRVIHTMGILTGQETAAAKLEQEMRERLNTVALALVMMRERPSVFFEVRSPSLLTVGKASMVTEIIEMAGGTNCMNSDRKILKVNEEELFRTSPEYYILQKGPMNSSPVPMPMRPRLNRLEAVINGHWHVVDEHIFSRPGPRNIEAVEELAKILHPALFETDKQQ